jgi:Peptidase family S41
MQHVITTVFVTFLICSFNSSQSQNTTQQNCTCAEALERLIQKIEVNYIGYTLTKREIGIAYEKQIAKYRESVKSEKEESCTQLLQGFLRFFKDEHLFVAEFPAYAGEKLATFKNDLKGKTFQVDKVNDYLSQNRTQLTTIEGVWTDGSSRFAVIKNENIVWPYQYVGIILSHTETEKIGELKFGINLNNGLYEGIYYTNKYAPRYVSIESVKENSMLSISGGILWGRIAEGATLQDPLKPEIKQVNHETVLLTIPSFLIEKNVMDAVLKAGSSQLKSARYLIIDIRGNGGGNGIYFDLLKWYADRKGEAESGLALSSPDNIAYFERFSGGKKNNLYGTVANDMQNMPGKIVKGPSYQPISVGTEKTKIDKVVILTDHSNASATEQFVIHSKQVSSKVITIGQNTKGVIDYQSVNMVDLNCGERGIYFGYPTSTRHTKIPLDGYNVTGIKPDVSTVKTGDELLAFALEQLQR